MNDRDDRPGWKRDWPTGPESAGTYPNRNAYSPAALGWAGPRAGVPQVVAGVPHVVGIGSKSPTAWPAEGRQDGPVLGAWGCRPRRASGGLRPLPLAFFRPRSLPAGRPCFERACCSFRFSLLPDPFYFVPICSVSFRFVPFCSYCESELSPAKVNIYERNDSKVLPVWRIISKLVDRQQSREAANHGEPALAWAWRQTAAVMPPVPVGMAKGGRALPISFRSCEPP